MNVLPHWELLAWKILIEHLFFFTVNILEAHHANVVNQEFLDIEVTHDLVKFVTVDDVRGGYEGPIRFLGEYESKFLVGKSIPCHFFLVP